jgi:hypothetical protein
MMENNCPFYYSTNDFILTQITLTRKRNQKYIKSWRRKKAKFVLVIEKQCKVGHGESE